MNNNSLKPLAITFFVSGIWDTIAAVLYFFVIGNGRMIDNPPVHPFYTVFLGSFFLCFAYLQFMSAFNINRYAFCVGCLVLGRLFYVVQLYAYMFFAVDFPSTFWFTGLIDGGFVFLYFLFARHGGLRLKDVFLPSVNYN
jgi:hypothetical protein